MKEQKINEKKKEKKRKKGKKKKKEKKERKQRKKRKRKEKVLFFFFLPLIRSKARVGRWQKVSNIVCDFV